MRRKVELLNPEQGQKIKLSGSFIRIGRAEDNEVILKDPSVSRYHIHIYLKDDKIIVEDAGSRSGFFVNGRAQKNAASLKKGDVLQVGNQKFTIGVTEIAKRTPTSKKDEEEIGNPFAQEENTADEIDPSKKRIRIYAAVIALMALFYAIQPEEKPVAPMIQDLEVNAKTIQDSLQKAEVNKKVMKTKSMTEMEAEGKFHEGLRDYHNGNFVRAIQLFNQSLTQDPNFEKAQDYVQYARGRLKKQINDLMQDGQRSFSLLQYQRAKSQFSQVLSILSEQIPGYWQREAQKIMNKESHDRRPAQEENLLNIPCEETKMEAKCRLAVELIKQSRILLGEENSLK